MADVSVGDRRHATGWFVGPRAAHQVGVSHHDRVRAYYLHTWKDFRGVWMDEENRALHFGWWDEGVSTHARSLVRANEVLFDAAGARQGERALDAGCGVGGTAMWAARHRGLRVVGVTLVHDQAKRFAGYARERAVAGARSVTADYEALPIGDGAVDLVYAQEALCHAVDKDGLLDELWRVLRPGGRLVAMEYVCRARAAESDVYRRWLRNWSMPALFEEGWLRAWLSGRSDEWELRDVSTQVDPSLRRLRRLCAWTLLPQVALNAIGLRSDVQVANVRGSLDLWRSYRRGDWFMGLIRCRKE